MRLDETINAAFDRRLSPTSSRPVAVAVSGGGDSVALLGLAAEWAARRGRRLLVLTVDHELQGDSRGWCEGVVRLADTFGAEARVLRWVGPKPTAGLPAAARAARHALLADAARTAGASVVLLGHTADDVLEGERMRAAGSTLGRLREWTPSPAWPEGRGVFLLRPMLQARRADLRSWLGTRGLPWVEDPANADLRYARARARLDRARPDLPSADQGAPEPSPPAWTATPDGRLEFERSAFGDPGAARAASAVLACAAGRNQAVKGRRLRALLSRLQTEDAFTSVLGGARIEAGREVVRFGREPGEARRGGLAPIRLMKGRPAVWDSRFELLTDETDLTVGPLGGVITRLPDVERRRLKDVPAAARGALPAVLAADGSVTSPLLATGPAACRELVSDRLSAALGEVLREP